MKSVKRSTVQVSQASTSVKRRKKSSSSHLKKNQIARKLIKVSLQVRKTKLKVYIFFRLQEGGLRFADGMGIDVVKKA